MIRLNRIWAILVKDCWESMRNKVVLIILILPIAASVFFTLLNNPDMSRTFHIGILDQTDSEFTEFVEAAVLNFRVYPIDHHDTGAADVEKGLLDGFIAVGDNHTFAVYLDNRRPLKYFALKENLVAVVQMYLGIEPEFVVEFVPLTQLEAGVSILPYWITITLTMIGVMVISGSVAEEKDYKTLDGIRVSPTTPVEILLGKGVFGVLLCVLTVLLILVVNRVVPLTVAGLLGSVFITLLGAIGFTAIGVLIGAVASCQSSARSIATMVYFPLLFPALIHDLSEFTRLLASFVPTFYLYQGLEKSLFFQVSLAELGGELYPLLGYAIFFSLLAYNRFTRQMKCR